jgi:hypothetical protein
MINELGRAVSLDMDIRSRGALSGGEGPVAPVATERPRSEPLSAMLSSNMSKKVGVSGMVMAWRREVARSARLAG